MAIFGGGGTFFLDRTGASDYKEIVGLIFAVVFAAEKNPNLFHVESPFNFLTTHSTCGVCCKFISPLKFSL